MSTHVSKHTRIQILTHMSTHMPVLLVQTQSACTSMSAQAYLSRAPARPHARTSSTGVLRHKQCVLLCSQSIQLRAHCHRMPRPHARTHARAHVRTCARMHAGKNSATPSSSVDLCPHCHGVDMCADICTDMCVLLAVYGRSQVHGGRRSCCMPVACRMPRAACRHTTLPLQTRMSHVACHVSYL